MAEAANARAALDHRSGTEDHEGFDEGPAADLGVPGEMNGVWRSHRHAGRQESVALHALEQGFGLSQLGLGVDAHYRVLSGEDSAGWVAALARQSDDIRQIVFALGVSFFTSASNEKSRPAGAAMTPELQAVMARIRPTPPWPP